MLLSEAAAGAGLFRLAPLVIFLPLAGMLVNLALGRRQGERFTGVLATSAIGLGFVVALTQLFALQGQPEGAVVPLTRWIQVGGFQVDWSMQVDTLSVTMMLMVTGVSTLIHLYATGYMHEDVRLNEDPGRYTRFFVFFNLFVASMMVLVTADNFLMMFVGWEGVGLCSYLLIGFWYEKGAGGIGNALAGKKAFITNRVGDFGFMIAMFLTFWYFGSLNFQEVFHKAEAMGVAGAGVVTAITLFLLVGATGKSAQIPLYVWLPDAMAGPTPVSALIHAATMVTAGVYMIVRNHVLFDLAPFSSAVVAGIGAATALFAATIAVGQYDIKKVLAYSTISQLGFMVAAAGMGAYVAAMFHLVAHAFFKALLFLAAGSVILGVEHGHHATAGHGHGEHDPANDPGAHALDPQDMRNMGGIWRRMPVTFVVFLIGGLALAGIPPLAGFFSKDEILADAWLENRGVWVVLTASAFLTAFYVGRQLLMVFFGKPRTAAAEHSHENRLVITLPLAALAVLTVLGGLLNLPGLHALTDWLGETLAHVHPTEFNLRVAATATGLGGLGLLLAWIAYGRKALALGRPDPLKRLLGPVFTGMENKWWVDELYQRVLIGPYVALAGWLAETVDGRFWHDWFHDVVLAGSFQKGAGWLAQRFDLDVIDGAANGLGSLTRAAAGRLHRLQTGYVRNYALAILVGLLLMFGVILLIYVS
ncbi:MAG: NADH-quinone oxidoreductase subunit L [Anaerolineales bacterium]|nr:NADH-quinone oxidoreductase subunit L [Anaerolineales bacterium]